MVQKPHLGPKTVRAGDKKVAERMKRTFILQLAADHHISVSDQVLDDILSDPELRDPLKWAGRGDKLPKQTLGASKISVLRYSCDVRM